MSLKRPSPDPSVSVLMPCRHDSPPLLAAVQSVLIQSECLELLVVNVDIGDEYLAEFRCLADGERRLRILCRGRTNAGPAAALSRALRRARGSLIAWLHPRDCYAPGALARAVAALHAHPNWLMVYGDVDDVHANTGLIRRFPTLPPSVGLAECRSFGFICPAAVLMRRSLARQLGPWDPHNANGLELAPRLLSWMARRQAIGYIPHLQAIRQLCAIATASQLPGLPESAHLQELFPPPAPCHWRPVVTASLANPRPVAVTPFALRPFGVNLIGHAFEVFGVGEDIRMAARALQAAGVPCCVIHHPAANGAACSDRSLEHLLCSEPTGGPYAFNLVCMAAPIQARWLQQGGCAPLRERYTLSSWPWETQQWPEVWQSLLQVADELWAPSRFIAAAQARPAGEAGLPLQVMPMAAEVTDPDRFRTAAVVAATRARHQLPCTAVLFGYGFDLNSTAIRKNPMAALEAFQRAFPLPHLPASLGRACQHHQLSEHVALLIKTFPPQRFSAAWHWLQARAAEDARIHLVAESLERDDLLALYGCCDVFLSLHRSEGFGRGIAEALQLGLDVIATDYGGNTEFNIGPLAHPVRCRPVPIPPGAYPCADGHIWAEPDLEHAAELCREVAARRWALTTNPAAAAADPSCDPAVLGAYHQRLACATAGARYRARLEALWADRQAIGERLPWRGDRSPLGW